MLGMCGLVSAGVQDRVGKGGRTQLVQLPCGAYMAYLGLGSYQKWGGCVILASSPDREPQGSRRPDLSAYVETCCLETWSELPTRSQRSDHHGQPAGHHLSSWTLLTSRAARRPLRPRALYPGLKTRT